MVAKYSRPAASSTTKQVRFLRDEPRLVDCLRTRAIAQACLARLPIRSAARDWRGRLRAALGCVRGALRYVARMRRQMRRVARRSAPRRAIDVDADIWQALVCGNRIRPIDSSASYACYVGPRAGAVEARIAVFDRTRDKRMNGRSHSPSRFRPMSRCHSISQDGPIARTFAVTRAALPLRSLPLSGLRRAWGSSGCVSTRGSRRGRALLGCGFGCCRRACDAACAPKDSMPR